MAGRSPVIVAALDGVSATRHAAATVAKSNRCFPNIFSPSPICRRARGSHQRLAVITKLSGDGGVGFLVRTNDADDGGDPNAYDDGVASNADDDVELG